MGAPDGGLMTDETSDEFDLLCAAVDRLAQAVARLIGAQPIESDDDVIDAIVMRLSA